MAEYHCEMNLLGLGLLALLGLIMVVTGIVGVAYYLIRYRRTRKQLDADEDGPSDTPTNTYASFFLLNGFLHIGFLLLILGGVGLLFYGR